MAARSRRARPRTCGAIRKSSPRTWVVRTMSLRISELEVAYGAIRALKGVTLEVPKGAIVTLLGANGAGKSTLVRAISGLVRPAAGAIEFNGVRLDRLRPDRIVQMGVVQVPEGRQVFPDLTVKENLLM